MTSPSTYDFRVDDFYSNPRSNLIESRYGAAKLRHGEQAIGCTSCDQTTRPPYLGRGTCGGLVERCGGLCPNGGWRVRAGRGKSPPIVATAIEFLERSNACLPLFAQTATPRGQMGRHGTTWRPFCMRGSVHGGQNRYPPPMPVKKSSLSSERPLPTRMSITRLSVM
jgi:hypothetical protein